MLHGVKTDAAASLLLKRAEIAKNRRPSLSPFFRTEFFRLIQNQDIQTKANRFVEKLPVLSAVRFECADCSGNLLIVSLDDGGLGAVWTGSRYPKQPACPERRTPSGPIADITDAGFAASVSRRPLGVR